jgi:hypothetical protein
VQLVAGGKAELFADLGWDDDATLLAHHDHGIHEASVPHSAMNATRSLAQDA